MERLCINCSRQAGTTPLRFSKLSTKLPRTRANGTHVDAIWTLFEVLPNPNSEICALCSELLKDAYTTFINSEEKQHILLNYMSASSPLAQYVKKTPHVDIPKESPPKDIPKIPSKRHTPIGKKMINSKKNKKYYQAFLTTLKRIIMDEMRALQDVTNLRALVQRGDSLTDVFESFNFQLQRSAPTVQAILQTFAPKHNGQQQIAKQIGILAVSLYSRNRLCNRLQSVIGLILWKAKANLKTYKLLNKFGFCCSYTMVNNTLDRLRKLYDQPIVYWREKVSKALEGDTIPIPPPQADGDWQDIEPGVDPKKRGKKRSPSNSPDKKKKKGGVIRKLDPEFQESEENVHDMIGLNFTFDNLNKYIKKGSTSSVHRSRMLNVVSSIGVFSRVPLPLSSVLAPYELKNAVDLPLDAFLPSDEELAAIKNDHVTCIKRILVKSVSLFALLLKRVDVHTTNEYRMYSRKQSKTVNMGIYLEDENTKEGMVEILKTLQTYLPQSPTGKLFPVIVWGDGLTADRVRSAQHLRLNSLTEPGKLDALYPGVSAWHKRVVLLQDDMNVLFRSNNLHFGKGSLPHLKALFGHVQAGNEVKDKFNPTVKFFRFVLHSYVTAYCMDELTELGKTSDLNKLNKSELETLLNSIAKKILDFSWHDVGRPIRQTRYCICDKTFEESRGKDWIGCENRECVHKSWYHKECLAMLSKSNTSNPFLPIPKSKKAAWFCSATCKTNCTDCVQLYSKAVIFAGLNQECYRDSIRENDGMRMKTFSKIHLIQLWNGGHHLYFRICHRVLSMLGGCAPLHVQHDLLWNSTVNVAGAVGKNLEIDLFNEFVNCFLKDHVLNNRGNYSPLSMQRRSQSFDIVKEIQEEIQTLLAETDLDVRVSASVENWREDIDKCVKILQDNKVFQNIGSRAHEGFENFQNTHMYVENIEDFKKSIAEKSKLIDAARRCWSRDFNPTGNATQH